MLPKPITFIAAGLAAATANAFMLPPGVSLDRAMPKADNAPAPKTEEPAFSALPFDVDSPFESRAVKLDCPGCPILVQTPAGVKQMKFMGSSHLDLEFAIRHDADHDRLVVNDFEVFPRSGGPYVTRTLGATVTPELPGDERPTDLATDGQELGFSLLVQPRAHNRETNADLISVHFQVIEVGSKFITGLDTVRVDLYKSPEGGLIITKLEQVAAEPADSAACTTLACRWRKFVQNYVNRIKPAIKSCGGRLGHGGKAPGAHASSSMHHNTHHSWARLWAKFSHTILLPILIGILAGISVSIIGMVVGTLLIGTWRVFVRGQPFFRTKCPHRRRSNSHKASAHEVAFVEEKSRLMDDQDAVPPYSDEEDKPAAV